MGEIQLGGFKYSYVHLIESLPEGHRTTRQLNYALRNRIQAPVGLRYHDVPTRAELFALLEAISSSVSVDGEIPVLHLECHGRDDEEGLVLASKEFVSWNDLWAPLSRINTRCAMHVLLVLGACYGANIIETMDPQERAPVWGVLTDSKKFLAGAALDAFPVFYEALFSTQDLAQALVVLRAAGLQGFDVFAAGQMFLAAYRRYLRQYCSGEALVSRAWGMAEITGVPYLAALAAYKQYERPWFERDRDRFFMFDLYPENRARFQVAYEDLKK